MVGDFGAHFDGGVVAIYDGDEILIADTGFIRKLLSRHLATRELGSDLSRFHGLAFHFVLDRHVELLFLYYMSILTRCDYKYSVKSKI